VSKEIEFEMKCPGCGMMVACTAVLGDPVCHQCPHCQCEFDVTVSITKAAK